MIIKGLKFNLTCSACPEQYDVENSEARIVGYIRLQHGSLTCEYPSVGGELIYSHFFDDVWQGNFESDDQREYHLNLIADRILKRIEQEN